MPKNPLEDPGLGEKFRLYQVDISGMTKKALEDLPLNAKEKERCKNFFALGLVSWIYTRPLDPTLDAIRKRFAKNPTFVEANTRVLKAGHAFGETAEMFSEHYGVEAAEMPPGLYRSMTGNRALAWGLLAAAERTQLPDGVRRVSHHARQQHPGRAGHAQALPDPDLPGGGRDRSGDLGDRRGVRRRDRRHRLERTRHRAQGRGHRARGDGRAAHRDLRHPARRPQHGPPHQDRAGRPDAGPVRTQQRVADRRDGSLHARRLLLHRVRGGADRRQVHGAGHGAVRRLPRQRVGALAHSRREDAARHPGHVPDRDRRASSRTCAIRRRLRGRGCVRGRPGSSTGSAASRSRTSRATSPTMPTTTTTWSGRAPRRCAAWLRRFRRPRSTAPRRAMCWSSAGAARTAPSRLRWKRRRWKASRWRPCICAT